MRLLRLAEDRIAWRGWIGVEGVRRRTGRATARPARTRTFRSVSGAAVATGCNTQTGRWDTTARHYRPGRQGRPEGGSGGPLAVDVILTPIYEPEFLGYSYGFRPGRGAHDALDALAFGIERRKVNWIIDADIRAFFDRLSRDHLLRFLEHRIGDNRVLRLITKWLNAGVMEDGEWKDDLQGTPQGAVVSPILANVYLHYVLDLWFQKKWRARKATGDTIIVRYADDCAPRRRRREAEMAT